MPARTRKRQLKWDEGRPKVVTLEDVARAAGVTSMTVSRVIKGKGYVSPATREKVLRLAEELKYTANLAARTLATGRTGIIAVMTGGLHQQYYANVVHVLESQLSASGYQIRLLHTRNDLGALINATNASAVDGVMITAQYGLVEEFRSLDPQVFQPCVFIDTLKHEGFDYVQSNLQPAVQECIESMLAQGRKRIAYAGDLSALPTHVNCEGQERHTSYNATILKAGRTPEVILSGYWLPPTQRIEFLKEHFRTHGCPDGIFCTNDESAIHVYAALTGLGYRIPEDVMLCGCDGMPFMECFAPPLSTIAPPIEEICALAWKFLQARIEKSDLPLQQASFDARLVVRKSLQSAGSEL